MIGEKTAIWKEGEYSYPAAYGFVPFIVSYIHEDDKIRPAMLVAPGGAYRYASPYEGNLPALEFYRAGYNVFVLAYTVNHLDELDAPLGMQPLQDISRAVRGHPRTQRAVQYRPAEDRGVRVLRGRASLRVALCPL